MEKEDNEWRRRDDDNDNHCEDSEVKIIVCGYVAMVKTLINFYDRRSCINL